MLKLVGGSGMNLYLDTCCYNRLFDDRTNTRIYYESNSIMLIFELIEKGLLSLIGSNMVTKEINDIPDKKRLSWMRFLYDLCVKEIIVNDEIFLRAKEIRNLTSIKYKDSIHIACAEYANVDVFLTTDIKLLKSSNKINLCIKVKSPNEWLTEVLINDTSED